MSEGKERKRIKVHDPLRPEDLQAVVDLLEEVILSMGKGILSHKKAITQLQDRALRYKGVYAGSAAMYYKNDLVTYDNHLWCCTKDTSSRPGMSSDWQLMCRAQAAKAREPGSDDGARELTGAAPAKEQQPEPLVLEEDGRLHMGLWSPGVIYRRGAVVSFGATDWCAVRETRRRPTSKDSGWTEIDQRGGLAQ